MQEAVKGEGTESGSNLNELKVLYDWEDPSAHYLAKSAYDRDDSISTATGTGFRREANPAISCARACNHECQPVALDPVSELDLVISDHEHSGHGLPLSLMSPDVTSY